jgi:hypothetical protein
MLGGVARSYNNLQRIGVTSVLNSVSNINFNSEMVINIRPNHLQVHVVETYTISQL